jgi:hypothetical protein
MMTTMTTRTTNTGQHRHAALHRRPKLRHRRQARQAKAELLLPRMRPHRN